MKNPEIKKSRVGAPDPGVVVLTRHTNAAWHAPDGDVAKHGLNARKHVFGLALASCAISRRLEMWAYILWSPADDTHPFSDGCWFVGFYDPEEWADMTKRRRIP